MGMLESHNSPGRSRWGWIYSFIWQNRGTLLQLHALGHLGEQDKVSSLSELVVC